MKKKTLATIFALLALGLMSNSITFADVGPKPPPACVMIQNLADFKNETFIMADYRLGTVTPFSITVLNDQSCINNYDDLVEIFAVDTNDYQKHATDKNYNPIKDINAYPAVPEFDLNDYADDNISADQQYEHKIYKINGIDNATRSFSISKVEIKTATTDTMLLTNTATPKVNLDKAIKADTSIFTDVTTSDKYASSTLFLKRKGYVKGYDDGTYKPNQIINRAEFTKIVMHDFKSTKTYDCSKQIFKDVSTDSNNWYRDYVCKAFNEGIIMGYGDNTFRPDQPITFAEAAKIILKVERSSTTDYTSDPWYDAYISVFTKYKIVPTSVFASTTAKKNSFQPNPNKQINRGEMALLIRGMVDPALNVDNPAKIDPLYTSPDTSESAPATSTPPAQPQPAAATIQNMAFSPTPLTIKKGATVTWTNNDPMAHTATSDSGSELASDNIQNGQTYSHTFNTVGTFAYHCAIHPSMHGSVIVTN